MDSGASFLKEGEGAAFCLFLNCVLFKQGVSK